MLMVEEADGRYDLQRRRARDDADDLFSAGDTIGPSDDVAPRSASHAPFSTNRLDGVRTALAITVEVDSAESASVTIEAPALADPCAALVPLCAGGCVVDDDGHGRCGDFLSFPPAPPDTPPGDAAGVASANGCSCASAGAADSVFLIGVGAALVVGRRRRRGLISLQP